jgi:hypothetical protein
MHNIHSTCQHATITISNTHTHAPRTHTHTRTDTHEKKKISKSHAAKKNKHRKENDTKKKKSVCCKQMHTVEHTHTHTQKKNTSNDFTASLEKIFSTKGHTSKNTNFNKTPMPKKKISMRSTTTSPISRLKINNEIKHKQSSPNYEHTVPRL